MELQTNQSKPIGFITNISKNRTSANAVATSKQALSFQIGGWLTEKFYCWIIHKGRINARLSVGLSFDRPWQEKAVHGKGYTEYSRETQHSISQDHSLWFHFSNSWT